MKVVYFIPAIIFTMIFGTLAMSMGISAFSPVILLWIVLFYVGAILLSKSKFWGGFLAALPGVHWIYLGTKDTGQIMNEMPMGIIIVIFYILCSVFVYFKRRTKG